MMDKCEWTEDKHDDMWETTCGNAHVFFDGGPKANNYKYCPYCGIEITEKPIEGNNND